MVDSPDPVIELPSDTGPRPLLLSFDYTMVAVFFITLLILAALYVGGLTLMDTDGNAVGSRNAGEALIDEDGVLVFAPVPARTLMGNIVQSQEQSTPAPLEPFPRYSVWMVDDSGLPGALPSGTGANGDVLTYINEKTIWTPPVFPHPERINDGNLFSASQGLFEMTSDTEFKMFLSNSAIQESLPYPIWNGRFIFSMLKPNPTGLLIGQLQFNPASFIPQNNRYRLRDDPGVNSQVSIDASVTIADDNESTSNPDFIPSVLCYVTTDSPRTIMLKLIVNNAGGAPLPAQFSIRGEIRIFAPLQSLGNSN
jgi:hypothetical protein